MLEAVVGRVPPLLLYSLAVRVATDVGAGYPSPARWDETRTDCPIWCLPRIDLCAWRGVIRARVPVEVVAARLGNTPRVVQEVYSHVIPADDQAAAQLVGDLYRRDVTNL